MKNNNNNTATRIRRAGDDIFSFSEYKVFNAFEECHECLEIVMVPDGLPSTYCRRCGSVVKANPLKRLCN
jgi:rRNA maturation endonuclease Nob1